MEHPSARIPYFGGASAEVAKKGVDIAHLQTAELIQRFFKGCNKDVRVGGLSLEDMAGRLQTLIGVYLLQGYFAVKDQKHPCETNGRNAIVWLMTLALTSITKSENYGVNTVLLNPFMKQKGAAVRFLPFLKQPFDAVRMDVDYLDIIEKAGIKIQEKERTGALKGTKALWASSWLDANKIEKIQNYLSDLTLKGDSLTREEKLMKEAIPKFFKRINLFNILSTGIITAATVYFIGGVAMRIVNKFISPMDKDFDGNKKNKPDQAPQPALTTAPSLPPLAFQPKLQPGGQATPFLPVAPMKWQGAGQGMQLQPPGAFMNRYISPNSQGGLN